MLGDVSPEVAAEASVLAKGGLDPCEYVVSAGGVGYIYMVASNTIIFQVCTV